MRCQRGALAASLAALAALAAPVPGRAQALSYPAFRAPQERTSIEDMLRRMSRMHVGGSLSLNWRNVGPRKPGFETQIQNEVYLADMYFGLDGPALDGVPIQLEWNVPTASRGAPELYQLNFAYKRVDNLLLQFGKFLVPFGRYNELYRPDQFLTITRPLLYASPDSLDLVIRNNSPRPPMTAGYTDIGARVSYYPPVESILVPDELTFYVVNGFGEATNRQRTFPNIDFLGVPALPGNGTTIDFGHQDNNLADNNNNKSLGGRVVWALGDVRFPWPIPEGASDLKGVNIGLSATGGQYDLESDCNYQIYGVDASFDYLGFNFSTEYLYAFTQFKAPIDVSSSTLASTTPPITRDWDVNRGYFVQLAFPIDRHPAVGERVTGVLVFNQIFRRGPVLDLLLNQSIGSPATTYSSVNAFNPENGRVTTRMDKYTAAVNYQLSDHFWLKGEYSYWTMGQASVRSVTSLGLVDIYQGAFSMVMGF